NEYQAAGKLQFCREDAQALGKVLVERGGFRPERVAILADGGKPEDLPTRGNIRRSVDQFAKLAEPEDTVLVFFSGHGMMAEDETGAGKKGYLMAVDSDRDPANNISIDWLKERLGACKAKTKLLVLDVCHAGSAKDVGGLAPSLAAGLASVAVLASCAADEISYVDEKEDHGVFAGRFIKGLAGEADADGDKAVSIAELHAYIKTSMKDWCVAARKTQTPVVFPETPPDVTLARVSGKPFVRPPALGTVPEWAKVSSWQIQEVVKAGVPVAKEVNLGSGVTMRFVYIPPGTFMIGSPMSEEGRYKDETQLRVTLTEGFYLGVTEVTQRQWRAVMGSEPWSGKPYAKSGDDYAASCISWDHAMAFCEALTQKTGYTFRLPTEAEWEYACRAGTTTAYCFGDDVTAAGDFAWYDANTKDVGEEYAHAVGRKRPNAWGLYDMHGNVWEWCQDRYGAYPNGSVRDPRELLEGEYMVHRGGCFFGPASGCRSALRPHSAVDSRGPFFGFRVVLGLK
ncbi:MAG TPA: SUMF1/EgtB/PvdO family nonheme iron enzyme, partial [Phycisphaerae bacterium]|nr:SUMF1/EgtB/PvdO family nonheme iron enzyme [Phycisphaerae bacterium]